MDAASIIREARRQARLSQRDLAARAGTSGPAISMYESGERVPRVDTLQRIVDASGATMTIVVEHDSAPTDMRSNGRRLAEVLDLADALPQRHDEALAYPILRDLLG